MRVFSPIGSKERLFEMLQRVNKITLNEENIINNPIENLKIVFNQLLNDEIEIKRITNDIESNECYTTIDCLGENNREINFVFKSEFIERETDGVIEIEDSKLINFFMGNDGDSLNIDENTLKEFNDDYNTEIIDFISNYINFEDDMKSKVDDLDEVIKLIDNIPYKRSTEELQNHKSYVDEKPTNPNLRVNSPELNSYVTENNDDFDDDFNYDDLDDEDLDDGLDYDDNFGNNLNNDIDFDDDSNLVNKYSDKDAMKYKDLENDYDDENISNLDYENMESSSEDDELYNKAFDNLMMKNKTQKNPNYFPSKSEVEREVNRISNLNKEPEKRKKGMRMAKNKTRVYPSWADNYLSENKLKNTNVDYIEWKYFNSTSDEFKTFLIKRADNIITNKYGINKFKTPKEKYHNLIRDLVVVLFKEHIRSMNESEDDVIKNAEDNENLNIGDVVEVNGIEGTFQIGVLAREGKPFIMPFDMNTKKPYTRFRIYLFSLKDTNMKRIMRFSETDGGFIIESEEEIETTEKNNLDIENLAKKRDEIGDQIEGGLGDDKSPLEFDPEQIKLGMKVEMEHTNDPMIALEIALDHLTEDPKYYTVKEDPEISAQFNASKEASEYDNEKELVDELLGYKPINVGDLTEEIVGSDNAKSVVGGQSSDNNDDEIKKYQEYEKKDFNSLRDDEKEEFFELWKKYREK